MVGARAYGGEGYILVWVSVSLWKDGVFQGDMAVHCDANRGWRIATPLDVIYRLRVSCQSLCPNLRS
jgi:hypothetical protein